MCRLFGITNFEFERHRGLISSFCALAVKGAVMNGDPPGHQDGWGLAYYRGGKAELLKSGASLAGESEQVMDALSRTGASPVVRLTQPLTAKVGSLSRQPDKGRAASKVAPLFRAAGGGRGGAGETSMRLNIYGI